MKKLLILPISLVFLLALATPLVTFAQTEEPQDDSSIQNNETETTTIESDNKREDTSKDKQARELRIQQAKDNKQLKLDAAEKKRLSGLCKSAQKKIAAAKNRVNGLSTSRSNVYLNLTNRLTALEAKLAENGKDTTALKAAIAELQTKIASFNTNLTAYTVGLTDLELMDCESDPEGFKAALILSRDKIKALKDESKAIHAYLKGDIKTILKSLKSDNQSGDNTESTEEDASTINEPISEDSTESEQ